MRGVSGPVIDVGLKDRIWFIVGVYQKEHLGGNNLRIFAVGDIHGDFDQFQKLLSKLEQEANFNLENDHLVLLGDLVDSGPKAKQVITWAIKTKRKYKDTFHPLKGNHEDILLDAVVYGNTVYKHDNPYMWWTQGGDATVASYGGTRTSPNIPVSHLRFMHRLPVYWQTDDYFFVHGGVKPNTKLADIDFADAVELRNMLWYRDQFIDCKFTWEKKIIFAHTPRGSGNNFPPIIKPDRIGLNTQPRYGRGYLTALEIPGEKIWRIWGV